MTFDEYQREAIKTKKYPNGVTYPLLALGEEVGEVQGKFAKYMRDGKYDPEAVKKELGDVLWQLSALCHELKVSLQEVAYANLNKLADRHKRGVIGGSGDNR